MRKKIWQAKKAVNRLIEAIRPIKQEKKMNEVSNDEVVES